VPPGAGRVPGGSTIDERSHAWRRVLNERGTSSVEFILIAPFLLLILFASVELSRAWFTMNLLTTAAREAVRAAVVAAPDQVASVGNARLTQILGAGNYSGGVSCSTNPCGQNSQVTANISMNFNTVVPNLLWMIPRPLVLQQTASMTFENWQ
jgi:Flp pilus assembly protein TadG